MLIRPESKRFIPKAAAQLLEVKKAKEQGQIVIGHGSTPGRVVVEILKCFNAGWVFIRAQNRDGSHNQCHSER